MGKDHLQKALQYTLHSDQYYSALNLQDTSGTPIGFYYCANTLTPSGISPIYKI